MSASREPLLELRDLSVFFNNGAHETQVTQNVSFSIAPGETVGLVGESGCGKTVTGMAIMGLLPPRRSRVAGEVLLEGQNLVNLSERAMRKLRGRKLSMIFQEPMSALDPVFTIGEQIGETLLAHRAVDKREVRDRVIETLATVGIPDPHLRYHSYPHQLSGGMRQRAMIAIALVCEPRILIADEPTTALDVTVQAQIVDALGGLCARLGMAMLFITHDLGLVSNTCSRVVTMYAGEVVEEGRIDDVLVKPRHPYSSGLLRSLPALTARKKRLPAIPGRVPGRNEKPDGCLFQPRCSHSAECCLLPQKAVTLPDGGKVRCCRYEALELPGVLS